MAAKLGDSEPGPSFSMDPEDHHRLSIELPTSRPVEQASLIMTAQERLRRLLTANRSIVQELSLPAVLRRIVETARDVAGAATGAAERDLVGLRYQKPDSIAWQAMQEGHGVRIEAVDQKPGVNLHLCPHVPVSQAMALPLRGETGPRGAVVAGRIMPHSAFTNADLDMAENFAGQAAIALELSDARANQQRFSVLEDRDRIASDLPGSRNPAVVRRGTQFAEPRLDRERRGLEQRLTRTVDELDETIRQIRTTIYGLQENSPRSQRGTALEVVDQIAQLLPVRPDI